jgi:hypothetical protein
LTAHHLEVGQPSSPAPILGTMTNRTKITNSEESLHNALELMNVLTFGSHH